MDTQIHLAGMEGKTSYLYFIFYKLNSGPDVVLCSLPPSSLHIHSCHHGNSTGSLLVTSGVESYLEKVGGASSEVVVVVDSLSTPLLHQSPAQVCRLLHQIGRLG